MRVSGLVVVLCVACDGGGYEITVPAVDAGPDGPPTDASMALGPSGLVSSRRLLELSEGEARQLCEWNAEQVGGVGTSYPCGTVDGIERCVERFLQMVERGTCTADVGDVEECSLAMRDDFCGSLRSGVCAANVACFSG